MPPPTASRDTPGDDETLPAHPEAPTHYQLVVTMPDEQPEVFTLKEGAQVVGRDLSCDIAIPHTSISRRHARLTVQGGTVTLEDLGSKNATFVDGEQITTAVALRPGSVIRFGLSIKANLKGVS